MVLGSVLAVRSSVRLSHVIHAQTVQHTEMPFAPSDRAMLDAAFSAVAKLLVYYSNPTDNLFQCTAVVTFMQLIGALQVT